MGKRGVPLVYQVYRDRMLKYANWRNRLHYADAKSILGNYGLPKPVRENVIKEMFKYKLIERENQHWIIIKGARKKCFFG
jgi:hypothetical protein